MKCTAAVQRLLRVDGWVWDYSLLPGFIATLELGKRRGGSWVFTLFRVNVTDIYADGGFDNRRAMEAQDRTGQGRSVHVICKSKLMSCCEFGPEVPYAPCRDGYSKYLGTYEGDVILERGAAHMALGVVDWCGGEWPELELKLEIARFRLRSWGAVM